ncbi:hypothetical protein BKA70DRAFT_1431142 [Coprinopsis sp. MPI-PUGE-AT-0042]|nr:hypothetical protein BKA70DRAFT_1431142 [Coprinopsis sp. MPI-PUGE-AT-0042]
MHVFAFKKLPKAREVRNADLYDLSLASRNFCTNGPNLCRSWIPIPSVIPSPLKKGGHSVNAIFASHPFTHSCQARHQGANDFEYTESAAYMAFEVDELEVPMHRGAVAFSTSTPPIGEGAIELSPILSKVYSTRGAAARPFFQCVSKWLPFYGGRYVAIDYHTTSTTSMVFLTGVANHQEFCCHRRCHRRDTKSRQHAPQASPVDPISHIATIPIFRPTSHPLLEGPSHRLIADARASAARHKLNALGPPLPPCNRNQRRQWVRIFVDDLQMHPVLYAHWIATRPDDMLLDAADLLLRSRPGLGPPAPRSNLKKSHSQRYKIGSPFAVFKNPEQYTAFHALVFHYSVERRLPKCEYPPVGYWIAEDAATFRIDNPFFREQGLYDPRRRIGQRHDVHLLNPSILSLVIPEDISVVLHDLDSWKPFASIVRNFSNSRPMLWWMKRVVDDAVGSRRTARKEEPGQLVQVGWTTGSRNNSSFDAARNLLRPHEDTTEADKENAFATAYFWRRVQLLHPPEVGNSIAAFYREHNIPLLDPDWPATRRVHRPVSVPTDTEPITFQDAEFAPGCLVMTERDCQTQANAHDIVGNSDLSKNFLHLAELRIEAQKQQHGHELTIRPSPFRLSIPSFGNPCLGSLQAHYVLLEGYKARSKPKPHYYIPDSDFDDSDEEISRREPRNEQNPGRQAERRVRYAERDAFRAEPASTITENNVSNSSQVYRRAELRNNATLELDAIRARTDPGPPLGVVYDGRRDWTTVHIFLWGCLFGIVIVGAIFAAWVNGAHYAEWRD